MKKLVVLLLLAFAFPAQAHVIKTDGIYEGMLHILPDDIAYAGTTTEFYFLFEEDKKIVTNCKCNVSITALSNNKVLFTKENIKDSFSFEYPKIGVYQTRIYRDEFSMTWDIRVDTELKKPGWFSVFVKKVRGLLGR